MRRVRGGRSACAAQPAPAPLTGDVVENSRELVSLLRASHTLAVLRLDGIHRAKSKAGRELAVALGTLIMSPCPVRERRRRCPGPHHAPFPRVRS